MKETIWDEICDIKAAAQTDNVHRPFYPMLIFRTPKGWTCPKYIDGKEDRGLLAFPPGAAGFRPRHRGHFEVLRTGSSPTSRKSCSYANGAVQGRRPCLHAEGRAAYRCQPNANGGVIASLT